MSELTPVRDTLMAESAPQKPGDYIGEDKLLHCGKCGDPKEAAMKLPTKPPRTAKIPILCQCEREEIEREDELRHKRYEMLKVEEIKLNSLMDEKFRDSTFAAFTENKHNARPLKLCKRYAEHFGEMSAKNQGLLLYGDVGTGKTYMAACIANHVMESLNACIMTSFVKILQNVQGLKGEEEEQRFIARLNRAELLIIDDLGAERGTDYALEKVYGIIDSRYRARKPMILTTNLMLADMQSAGDIRYLRIYDRIFEVCYPIEFKGPSWRKEEAARRYDDMTRFLEGQ